MSVQRKFPKGGLCSALGLSHQRNGGKIGEEWGESSMANSVERKMNEGYISVNVQVAKSN